MTQNNKNKKKSSTLSRPSVNREIILMVTKTPGQSIPQITQRLKSKFDWIRVSQVSDKIVNLMNRGQIRVERDRTTNVWNRDECFLFIEDPSKYYKNLGLPKEKWVKPK